MRVELYPEDIRPEFRETIFRAQDVTFQKLNDKAQEVVRASGHATFYHGKTEHQICDMQIPARTGA